MTEKLKSCAHCETTKEPMAFPPTCKKNDSYNPAERAFPVVRCVGCYAQVPGKDWDYSCKSAIAAWNTRALPLDAIREEKEILIAGMEACQKCAEHAQQQANSSSDKYESTLLREYAGIQLDYAAALRELAGEQ